MRRLAVFLFLLLVAASAQAAGPSRDMAAFARLPVLHEGRVKPLDSFARIELRRINGSETPPGGGTPVSWLAQALFDPARAAQRPLFAVRDDGLRRQIGLSGNVGRRYSLAELAPGLARTEDRLPGLLAARETLTPPQEELLSLHDRALGFAQILGALGMVLPLEGVPVPAGTAPRFAQGPTWLELKKSEAASANRLKKIVRRKGADMDRYTPDELALALSGLGMETLRAAGRDNTLLRIMPPQWAGRQDWLSPWASLESGEGGPQGAAYLTRWQDMAYAWRAGDRALWAQATRAATDDIAGAPGVSAARLQAETAYNTIRPFFVAEILYALALLALLTGGRWKLDRFAPLAAGAGMLLHAGGIAARMFILSRPPVGTLYESLLFVSLVVLGGAMIAARGRDGAALRAGLFAALGILLAAPAVAPQGDSLEMLVAVLNTGFWLTTHVICITAGYGVSILAATLAHVALYRRDAMRERAVHVALAAALFLTAFGTVLGGIWADQSWGRFWGWDPKENGALLIVLWIAWILHGRMCGRLRGVWLMTACAFLNVIVGLSWFGVNLLNIGLHSYGFTDAAAVGFIVFCAAEIALIAALVWRARGRELHAA